MESIVSGDGVRIAYERTGSGVPFVLVHGTSADAESWSEIRPALEAQFTVCGIDRRGRRESGDAVDYDLAREVEDVTAVVDSFEEPVHLLGHSFGGICALEAALRTDNVRTLVLYEPPIPGGADGYYDEAIRAEFESLLADGEDEAVLELFLRKLVDLPPAAIDSLRSADTWPSRVAAAHTVVREYAATGEYAFDPARFEAATTPTLLVTGGESPDWAGAATDQLAEALPDSRTTVLPDQGHVGYATAPDRFVDDVIGFVRASTRPGRP